MPIEQVSYDKWFGGMAQDDLYTQESQFAYAEGVDIKENSGYVKLGRNVKNLFTTNGNQMLASKSLSSHTFFFGEEGEVYYEGSANDTPIYISTTADITDAETFNGILYYVQTSLGNAFKLYNITEANADALSWSGNVSNFVEGGGSGYSECILLNYQDTDLYVGAGKTLHIYNKVDILTGIETNLIDFKSNIKGLTYVGSNIKVYTEDGNVTFLNALDYTTREVVNIRIKPAIVKTINNYDYIIAGYSKYDSQLVIMSGHEIQTIAKVDREGFVNKFHFPINFGKTIGFDGKQIYFAQEEVGENLDSGIMSYGNSRVGLPEGFNINANKVDLSQGVQEGIGLIKVVHPFEGRLYFGYNGDTSGESVGEIVLNADNTTRTQLGTLITKNFNAGSSTLNKDLVEIEVYGEFNGNVKIAVQKNGEYTTSGTTTWMGLDNGGDINEPIRISEFNSTFNSIALKFEFSGDFEEQLINTDKLYGVRMKYNITRQ